MTDWQNERQELHAYYDRLRGRDPALEQELNAVLNSLDDVATLVRARRALELIVTDLCERELHRPRGTDPMAGLIDRLKKDVVPEPVAIAMGHLNQLGSLGAHPKPFTPQEVRHAFGALVRVVDWYFAEYKRGLGEPLAAAPSGTPSDLALNPYLGLDSFQEKDAERFFGRETLIEQELWPAFQALLAGPPRLMALLGPSGSGKSSVARAGLLPRIKAGLPCRLLTLTPTHTPLDALANALARHALPDDPAPAGKAQEFRGLLVADDKGLTRIAALLWEPDRVPLVMLLDQAEEVFSLCQDPTEQGRFLENLLAAVTGRTPRLYLLLTLRSDFLGETQRFPAFNTLLTRQARFVPVLDEAGLRMAIAEPARRAGHPLDEALVQLLVEQSAGRDGALPLLQYALTEVWRGLQIGQPPEATLRACGGVGGALAGRAQEIYDSLASAEQAVARRCLLRLVQLGEGGPDTRRRVVLDDLMAEGETRVDLLGTLRRFAASDARLLTLGRDAEDRETVEITHDALIGHWQALQDWLNANREFLLWSQRLTAILAAWQGTGRDTGSLLGGAVLTEAESWQRERRHDLSAAAVEFIQASIAERERAERARRRGKRRLIAALSLGLVGALTLGWLWIEVGAARRHSLASLYVARSKTALQDNAVDEAFIAALGGLHAEDTVETRSAAFGAMLEVSPFLVAVHDRPDGTGEVIAWSGVDTLAILGRNGIQRIEVANPGAKPESVGLANESSASNGERLPNALSLSFGPDGRGIAVFDDGSIASVGAGAAPTRGAAAAIDGSLNVIPGGVSVAKGGGKVAIPVGDDRIVLRDCAGLLRGTETVCADMGDYPVDRPDALALAPDGTRLAVADANGRISIHALTEGFPVVAHREIGSSVSALDWSASNDRLAVGTRDGQLWILDAGDSAGLRILEQDKPATSVSRVQWSPEGARLAFVCDAGDICGRPFETVPGSSTSGGEVTRYSGHRNAVTDLAWSPNGRRIASVALDHTLRVWSVGAEQSQHLALQTGTSQRLLRLAVHHGSGRIAAGDERGDVWVWSLDGGRSLLPAPARMSAPVTDLAWNPQGQLVCVYENQAIGYWAADEQKPRRLDPLPGAALSRIAVLGDGRSAVPLRDGRVALLSASRSPPAYLDRPDGARDRDPWGITGHPDGRSFFVSYTDGSIHAWDQPDNGHQRVLVTAEVAGPGADGAGSLAISADGRLLAATRNDNVVVVYDAAAGQVRHRLVLDRSGTVTVAFSTSAEQLAALAADGRLYVWDLDAPNEPRLFSVRSVPDRSATGRTAGAGRKATWLQWLDADRIAVTTVAGEVKVYSLDANHWNARAQTMFGTTSALLNTNSTRLGTAE